MPIFQLEDDCRRRPFGPNDPSTSRPTTDVEIAMLPPPVDHTSTQLGTWNLSKRPEFASDVRPEGDKTPLDRTQLIERLKKGVHPTLSPTRRLETILGLGTPRPPGTSADSLSKSPFSRLLPAAHIEHDKFEAVHGYRVSEQNLNDGLSIERPRSALHTGDFTIDNITDQQEPEIDSKIRSLKAEDGNHLPASDGSSWVATTPPRDFAPLRRLDGAIPFFAGAKDSGLAPSPSSSSFSSSFAYIPPTSPLVQSESNDETGFSLPPESVHLSSFQHSPRLPPCTFSRSSIYPSPSSRSRLIGGARTQRRDGSLPYQAHQPRRSASSTSSFFLQGLSPQSPIFTRPRRTSLGSDTSPIQHASMVGSYEESILRGRMSTTPSRPFEFMAQIGVLGKGNCKPSLRCPSHVTLPFAAVYYSYGGALHGLSRPDDGPSPYVGQIDLENGLANPEGESRSRRKAQCRLSDWVSSGGDLERPSDSSAEAQTRLRASRPKRHSGAPRAPPGGSYRIPEKGQVQIIIKNQNKTAVKLFLVPYDLAGMEAGTKTFIRQRSYSAGPIIDHVPNPGRAGGASRPVLRYLVHLHICCPAKGRYYLYKSIRVVFANRVPEGKEKLENETTWPEPRFTPYKPIRLMHPPASSSAGPAALLATEKAFRRRSLGVLVGVPHYRDSVMMDGTETTSGVVSRWYPSQKYDQTAYSGSGKGNALPLEAAAFGRYMRHRDQSDDTGSSVSLAASGLRSPALSQTSRPSTNGSRGSGPWDDGARYDKLGRDGFAHLDQATGPPFSGNGFPALGTAQGLLSQRLRLLDVKPREPGSQDDWDPAR